MGAGNVNPGHYIRVDPLQGIKIHHRELIQILGSLGGRSAIRVLFLARLGGKHRQLAGDAHKLLQLSVGVLAFLVL